jgi:hypothetical protein
VPRSGSDFKGPLGHRLTAHVSQIESTGGLGTRHHRLRSPWRPARLEDIHHLGQTARTPDGHAIHQRCFRGAGGWQHQPDDRRIRASPTQRKGHGQRTSNRPQVSAEGQLTRQRQAFKVGQGALAHRRQDAHRDGQVETTGFLGQVSRGQVDGDAPVVRERQPGARQRRPHALSCLLDFGVGQADQGEGRQAIGQVHLNGDFWGSQPIQGQAADDGK